MLNKKNLIISSLASVMLTYSFNYIAIAGLGNIKTKGVNNNANLSINKPSHLINSASKGIAVRNHTLVLKSLDMMKTNMKNYLPNAVERGELTEDPVISEKRRRVSDMLEQIKKEEGNEEILDSFNPYQVRLARLYKDHKSQELKINNENQEKSTQYAEAAEVHKQKMNETKQALDKDISGYQDKLSDIYARIKAKEFKLDTDVKTFFINDIQPKITTTINFDKLTVGSLVTTIGFAK